MSDDQTAKAVHLPAGVEVAAGARAVGAVRVAVLVHVEAGLAGCVNIVRNIRSIYRWQNKIEDDTEVLMMAKTQKHLFDAVAKKVKELHSYEVPEIIAVPIVQGSEDYLRWLKDVTG